LGGAGGMWKLSFGINIMERLTIYPDLEKRGAFRKAHGDAGHLVEASFEVFHRCSVDEGAGRRPVGSGTGHPNRQADGDRAIQNEPTSELVDLTLKFLHLRCFDSQVIH